MAQEAAMEAVDWDFPALIAKGVAFPSGQAMCRYDLHCRYLFSLCLRHRSAGKQKKKTIQRRFPYNPQEQCTASRPMENGTARSATITSTQAAPDFSICYE